MHFTCWSSSYLFISYSKFYIGQAPHFAMSFRDNWPKMPNGINFDGRHLLALVRQGKSPFHDQWDVNLLVQEIEKNLDVQVDDIPYVSQGSNCYVSREKILYKRIIYSMLT